MAGKIALGIIALVGASAFSFFAGRMQERNEMLECKVVRYVPETDTEGTNMSGIPAPFTVVVNETPVKLFILPGFIGDPGDIVYVPSQER